MTGTAETIAVANPELELIRDVSLIASGLFKDFEDGIAKRKFLKGRPGRQSVMVFFERLFANNFTGVIRSRHYAPVKSVFWEYPDRRGNVRRVVYCLKPLGLLGKIIGICSVTEMQLVFFHKGKLATLDIKHDPDLQNGVTRTKLDFQDGTLLRAMQWVRPEDNYVAMSGSYGRVGQMFVMSTFRSRDEVSGYRMSICSVNSQERIFGLIRELGSNPDRDINILKNVLDFAPAINLN